jgi:hypothetical protein
VATHRLRNTVLKQDHYVSGADSGSGCLVLEYDTTDEVQRNSSTEHKRTRSGVQTPDDPAGTVVFLFAIMFSARGHQPLVQWIPNALSPGI